MNSTLLYCMKSWKRFVVGLVVHTYVGREFESNIQQCIYQFKKSMHAIKWALLTILIVKEYVSKKLAA